VGDIDREYESDYARYVLEPDPETLIELVDLKRKSEKENGPSCDCQAVDLPANHNGVCPICQGPK
jgi:hypothetical protein